MKSDISHLPENKQKEILEVLEIILEVAKPDKVILFGSHTSNRWVEDEYNQEGIKFSYISDYDFLVVINHSEKKEFSIISEIESRSNHIKNPVSIIVHSLDYINDGLSFGQYFFTEIINEGIILFDNGLSSFLTAKELTLEQKKQKSWDYFNLWFPKGLTYLKGANFYLDENEFGACIFSLHQSAECFYSAVLLVYLGYRPKTHNLQKLRNYSKHISDELFAIFKGQPSEEAGYIFGMLKKAYIDARYQLNYDISVDDLNELIKKVNILKVVVKALCEKKMIKDCVD